MSRRVADSRDKEQIRIETRRRVARNTKQLAVGFIATISILLLGKGLYSVDQSIKHMYEGTTNELVREKAEKKAMDETSEHVRTGKLVCAKKPVQFKEPTPIEAQKLATVPQVHPQGLNPKGVKPVNTQQLYDRAVAERRLYPEKSFELLSEIIKRGENDTDAGADLLFKAWSLMADLGSDPYALYRNALYYRNTNIEGSRRSLAMALKICPDEQLKQKILSLQTELSIEPTPAIGSEVPQAKAPTRNHASR